MMLRYARVLSFLGHPLLTTSGFLLFIGYRSSAVSLRMSALVIAVVVLPVALWNLLNTRSGAYSNFDVSTRTERHSMYYVSLALMVAAAVALYLSQAAFSLRAGMSCMLGLFAIAAAANRWIKLSLHAAVSFYFSVILSAIDWRAGVVAFGLAVSIALSRLMLKRHTAVEVAWGNGPGAAGGVALLVVLG